MKKTKSKKVARPAKKIGTKKSRASSSSRKPKASAADGLRSRVAELERQVKVAERLRFESLRQRPLAKSGPFDAKVFVAGIAHEFNNILGAADGHAEWALESGDAADMREALGVIRTACQRCARITKSLQGLVQPREEGKALFAIRPIAEEVAQLFRTRFEQAKVEARFEIPDVKIYGDAGRLLDVLVNLVKNSIESLGREDFTGRSKPDFRPKISVEGRVNGKALQLRVEDNGPGVPGVFRDFIFQPFFTTKGAFAAAATGAESAGSEGAGPSGTGLGLYLARQIVEEHGGTLECLKPSSGACFEIRLPLT